MNRQVKVFPIATSRARDNSTKTIRLHVNSIATTRPGRLDPRTTRHRQLDPRQLDPVQGSRSSFYKTIKYGE